MDKIITQLTKTIKKKYIVVSIPSKNKIKFGDLRTTFEYKNLRDAKECLYELNAEYFPYDFLSIEIHTITEYKPKNLNQI